MTVNMQVMFNNIVLGKSYEITILLLNFHLVGKS